MARSSGLQQQPRVSSSQHGAEQEMADGGSSKRSGSQTALSLLFSLESGDVAEVRTKGAEVAAFAPTSSASADALRVLAEAELERV